MLPNGNNEMPPGLSRLRNSQGGDFLHRRRRLACTVGLSRFYCEDVLCINTYTIKLGVCKSKKTIKEQKNIAIVTRQRKDISILRFKFSKMDQVN